MDAILIGSISALADTSDMQREAFNEAFAQHGLDWTWEGQDYRDRLQKSGGRQRVADYAEERGQKVNAAQIHADKTEIFQRRIREQGLTIRPETRDLLAHAADKGIKTAFVSTTLPGTVDAYVEALADQLPKPFDIVLNGEKVGDQKPAPTPYIMAANQLGVSASDCLAVEDNVQGAESALAAGATCLAYPNADTETHEFPGTRPMSDWRELLGA